VAKQVQSWGGKLTRQGKTAAASPMAVIAATMLSELSFTALSTSATVASLDGKRSKPRLLLISLRTAEMEGADVTGGTGACRSLRIAVLLRRKSLHVRRLLCRGWFNDAAMRRRDATAAVALLATLGTAAATGVFRPASAGCRGGRPSASAGARLDDVEATPPPSSKM
jgi:hypothetical protein